MVSDNAVCGSVGALDAASGWGLEPGLALRFPVALERWPSTFPTHPLVPRGRELRRVARATRAGPLSGRDVRTLGMPTKLWRFQEFIHSADA